MNEFAKWILEWAGNNPGMVIIFGIILSGIGGWIISLLRTARHVDNIQHITKKDLLLAFQAGRLSHGNVHQSFEEWYKIVMEEKVKEYETD